jgi:hypothetical protein
MPNDVEVIRLRLPVVEDFQRYGLLASLNRLHVATMDFSAKASMNFRHLPESFFLECDSSMTETRHFGPGLLPEIGVLAWIKS